MLGIFAFFKNTLQLPGLKLPYKVAVFALAVAVFIGSSSVNFKGPIGKNRAVNGGVFLLFAKGGDKGFCIEIFVA